MLTITKSGLLASAALAVAMTGSFDVRAVEAGQVYALDPGHTEIRAIWNHAGVSDQSGEFDKFEGELDFDPKDPTKSSLTVKISSASISTGFDALDKHLISADFFEVEKYPDITFKSTGVKQSSAEHAMVSGDLTIHGVTKPVTLDVQLIHKGEHPLGQFIDYYKGQWLGFKASTTILRSDFDVGRFAPLTSDRVEISISTELKAK